MLEKDVHDSVQEVLKQKGFTEEYNVDIGCAKGDNYVSEIYRITLINEKKNFILKHITNNEYKREKLKCRLLFEREGHFYEKILPILRDFTKTKSRNFESTVDCLQVKNNYFLLEDVKSLGYVMEKRQNGLQNEHVKLVMIELAKFHALSFAYYDQFPAKAKDLFKDIDEVLFGKILLETAQPYWKNLGYKMADEYRIKFETFSKELIKNMIEITNYKMYSCLTHGDCWTNNILFKYVDQRVKHLKFLDFQLIRISSPVLDIAQFIYSCTTQSIREENHEQWLDLYYNTLFNELTELGSDPTKVYPRTVYQQHLTDMMRFGVGMAAVTLPLFTAQEEVPELNENKTKDRELVSKLSSSQLCIERMNEVVSDAVNRGYL